MLPEEVATTVIGIGTSPLILMRAIELAKHFGRVVLFDRAHTAGGAWAAGDHVGLSNVEDGVHLLENRPTLLRALREDLDVAMLETPAFGYIHGRRIPLALARVLLQTGAATKALARLETDKARRTFRNASRSARDIRHRFYYPSTGASAITMALVKAFTALGGEIRFGVEVREIHVNGSGISCTTSRGVEHVSRALIGSRAFAPVTIDGRVQILETDRTACQTAVIRLSGAINLEAGYVEMLADRVLKRARDLSPFVSPALPSQEKVVAVQYRQGFSGSDGELGEGILVRLGRMGLVEPNAKLLDTVKFECVVTTLTDRTMQQLAERGRGTLETVSTTDFADGFVTESRKLVST